MRPHSIADSREPRVAIVLCGGQSRRMGADKAMLAFRESTLLQRVLTAIEPAVDQIAIVGQASQRPERTAAIAEFRSRIALVDDLFPDRGPLEGLRAGLRSFQHLPDETPVFVCGCDQPLLTTAVVDWLFDQIAPEVAAAVPQIADKLSPLPGVYRLRTLATVERLLDAGERSLQSLLAAIPIARIPPEALRHVDPHLDSLRSANTPAELADLTRIADNKR